MAKTDIKHTGIISKVTDNKIEVTIAVSTACSGCHAASSCFMADNSTRIISINKTNQEVNIGERVNVVGSRSIGLNAVFFAYVLPFIAVMLTLVFSLSIENTSELRAGLYSILILPPYYLVLYLFKRRFEKKYTFRIVSE